MHDGLKNTYTFWKDNKKIILVPTIEEIKPKPKQREANNFLSLTEFEEEVAENKVLCIGDSG